MHLIVLRPDGPCARLPRWLMAVGLGVLLLGLLVAVGGAYWLGLQQREVVEVPVLPDAEGTAVDAAERAAAVEGLEYLAGRVVVLERELERAEARLASLGEDLELDLGAIRSSGGGQGGPLAAHAESPLDLDERLHALERLLLRHRMRIDLLDEARRDDATRATLRPALRPVEDDAWVSSGFGHRDDPFTGERRFHAGMDFAGRSGSEVRAAGGGIVVYAGRRNAYGRMVEIEHGGGLRTRYAHNDELLVEPGQRVEPGDLVARMGRTGRATDTHLHYEVLRQGEAVNPYAFLPD
ncbi:MAG: M23 family metallopeptidase [Pseudomonadota bacterium]